MRPIFKLPTTRQPQGAVQLDDGNPLAQRPAFVVLPALGREVVWNIPIARAGSTPPTIVGTPKGVASKHAGGVGTVSYLSLGAPVGPTVGIANGPCTFVGVFYASAASGVAIAERNDSNSVDAGWMFGYVDANSQLGLGFVKEFSGANVRKSLSNALAPGLNTLVATYDGGTAAAGISVYLNGVLGTVAGTTDGSGTSGSEASQTLYIGRNSFYSDISHNGSILLAGAFNRIWTAAEVRSFNRNPWQLFAAPARAMLVEAGGPVSAALTGVAATGAVGTVAPANALPITGTVATGAAGTTSVAHTQPLTGAAATGAVGTVAALADSNVALTGVQATGAVGTVALTHTQPLTGNAATGSPGTVAPALAVPLTGVQATGAVGTVTALAASNVALTGNAANGAVGAPGVTHTQPLTGASATGAAGTVAPSTVIGLTGAQATGAVGTVSVTAANEYPLSGVQGTSAIGTLAPGAAVALSGAVATGQPGSVTATASKAITGAQATGAVGAVAPSLTVGLTGAQATGAVGTAAAVVTGNVTVGLSGVSATGAVGTLTALGGDVGDTSTGGGQDPSESPRRPLPEQTQAIYPRRSKTAAAPAQAPIPEPISAKAAIQPAIGGKTSAIESAGELALSQLRVLELQSRQAAIAAQAAEMAQMQQAHAIALAEIEAAALMASAMRRREDEDILLLLLA